MARPQKNNAEYFSRDGSMRNHRKIKALRNKYGLEGYAIWNMLLEALTESEFFEITLSEQEYDLIAGDINIESDQLKKVIAYCEELNLLQNESGILCSANHKERMKPLIDKRARERKRANSKLNKENIEEAHKSDEPESSDCNSEKKMIHAESQISVAETHQSKVHKSEANKIKEDQSEEEKKKETETKEKSNKQNVIDESIKDQLTKDQFISLSEWIGNECKNVCKMKQDLIYKDYKSLIKHYSTDSIKQNLIYLDAILTAPHYDYKGIDRVALALFELGREVEKGVDLNELKNTSETDEKEKSMTSFVKTQLKDLAHLFSSNERN